jgi:Ca2+-binding RTX toxin-like protein
LSHSYWHGGLTVTTGTGDNTLVVEEDDTVVGTTVTFNFGTGTGTLDLSDSADITLGTMSFTGLDVIDIGSASIAAEVNATLLNGTTTITVSGDGTATDMLTVDMTNTSAASVDFSGVTIASGVTTALAGLNVVGSGVADTIIGTDGDDTITGGLGDDVITGGDGDDTLVGGGGDDTYLIAFGGEGADTITFVLADDVIDFTGTSDVVDGAADGSISVGGFDAVAVLAGGTTAISAAAGFNFVTDTGGNDAASLAVADVATFLGDTDAAGAGSTFEANDVDDDFYIAVTDGADVGIYFYEGDGVDTVIDAADLTLIATLDGITSFAALNIVDFI